MNERRLNGTSTEAEIALASFPSMLSDDVQRLLDAVDQPKYSTHLSGLQLLVRNEYVEPPSRIYWTEPSNDVVAALTRRQHCVLNAYFTRHHDGYVRERHLRSLLGQGLEYWSIPYVVWLLGEYVKEICELIAENAPEMDAQVVHAFAQDNPEFIGRLRRQVISYWSCYWRRSMRLPEYPGFIALRALGLWHGTEGRKVIRRGW